MPSEKAYKTGSSAPDPPASGVLRLISMRFCPFAHRTRLVLAAKGIEYETVNVSLTDKPEWFFDINPLAKVPTLQHDGKIVYESLVCNEYLDQVFPGRKMLPEDPLDKARIGMLQAIFDAKILPNFYKILRREGKERQEAFKLFMEGLSFIEKALATSGKPFLGGDQPGYLDYSIWPWFERLDIPLRGEKLPEAELPNIVAWQTAMADRPEVKACAFDLDTHTKFIESYYSGNPDPDIGLAA